MRVFRSVLVPTLVSLLAVFSIQTSAAASDIPSEIANCADWQNAKKRDLLEACVNHTGCELMLKSRNSCAAAQEFVTQLEKTLAGKNEINNETVFYAALPKLTKSKAMESMIAETRSALEDHRKIQMEGSRTYKNDAGEVTYYYEGGVKDELRHGVGIMIGRNGSARYGQFIDNAHTGHGWAYLNSGTMFVGFFSDNSPHGDVAYQGKDGVQIFGRMVNNKYSGVVNAITLNGTTHTKAFHDENGKQIGKDYPGDTPDQTVILAAKAAQTTPPQQPGSTSQQPSTQEPSGANTTESKADLGNILEKMAHNPTSPSGSTYTSVCGRNWEKIYDIFRSRELRQAGATNDLFMQDIHWHMAKLYKPCKDTDQESADAYAEAMNNYNSAREYCAGPHQKWECTQWGANGGKSYNQGSPYDNIEYTRVWKEEVNKAVSDPNYSAEYGPVKWTGKSNPGDTACWKGLNEINKQYNAEKKNIPENSIVVLSEATMWKIAKSTELISAKCPNSSEFLPEISRMKHVYAGIQRACDASSSSPPCVPRLPGKPSVQPPAPVAKPLPPLVKPMEESCGLPPSANAVKCLEAKCAKQEGELSLNKKGCAFCNTKRGSDYWFICPDGIGGAR